MINLFNLKSINLNKISKLILIIFLIFILFFNSYYATILIIISCIIIFILYYSQRKNMSIEYYIPTCNSPNYLKPPTNITTCTPQEIKGNTFSLNEI